MYLYFSYDQQIILVMLYNILYDISNLILNFKKQNISLYNNFFLFLNNCLLFYGLFMTVMDFLPFEIETGYTNAIKWILRKYHVNIRI